MYCEIDTNTYRIELDEKIKLFFRLHFLHFVHYSYIVAVNFLFESYLFYFWSMKKVLLDFINIFLPPKDEDKKKYREKNFLELSLLRIWLGFSLAVMLLLLIALVLL